MIINHSKYNSSVQITTILGNPYTLKEKRKYKKHGSSFFFLEEYKSLLSENDDEFPKPGARCNFEQFEKGLLLRINSNQNLFSIPINIENTETIHVKKGKETVALLSPGYYLYRLGVNIEFLKRFRIFKNSIVIETIKIDLNTTDERIVLKSHGRNFNKEIRFLIHSDLRKNVTVQA